MGEFVIVGAGAIGAIVGVTLIEAGHDVCFIDANRDHVEAVRAGGLRLSGHRQAKVAAPIATPEEAGWPLRHVLLAVKAPHTLDALQPLANRIAPDGFVVSLQNGLEEYRIAEMIGPDRTIGAFLTFGGHYKAPGEVVFGGPGAFRIGEIDGVRTTRTAMLRQVLSALQPVEVTDNIFGFLWSKIVLSAIYLATATADSDVVDLYAVSGYRDVFGRLAGEVVTVADAESIRLERFDGFDPTVFRPGVATDAAALAATWAGQNSYWNAQKSPRTGMWRDLAIHRRNTEVDRLIGPVIEMGRKRDISTPGLARLVAIIKDIENGRTSLGRQNLDAIY